MKYYITAYYLDNIVFVESLQLGYVSKKIYLQTRVFKKLY